MKISIPIFLAFGTTIFWGLAVSLSGYQVEVNPPFICSFMMAGKLFGSMVCLTAIYTQRYIKKEKSVIVFRKIFKEYKLKAILSVMGYPFVSICGFFLYNLSVNASSNGSLLAVYGPLSGLCVVPVYFVGIIWNKEKLTGFTLAGIFLSVSAVILAPLSSYSLIPDQSNDVYDAKKFEISNKTQNLTGSTTFGANLEDVQDSDSAGLILSVVFFAASFFIWGFAYIVISTSARAIPPAKRFMLWATVEVIAMVIFFGAGCIVEAVRWQEHTFEDSNTTLIRDGFFVQAFGSWNESWFNILMLAAAHFCNRMGVYTYQEACKLAPLVVVVSIANMYPIVPTLLSVPLFGEKFTLLKGALGVSCVIGPILFSMKHRKCPDLLLSCRKHNAVVPDKLVNTEVASKELTEKNPMKYEEKEATK